MSDPKKRSLSGIKPTGTGSPHLGNYMGMIQPAIALQKDYETYYFVADYHALTALKDADRIRQSTLSITAYFLAFGLDTNNGAFFRQSDVPEVTELAWILSCVTHMGLLQRAHSYKDAINKGLANEINHGVFSYPVLMAADILIYGSDVVPVGKDQKQHLEITRTLARKFNTEFGKEVFKLPKARINHDTAVIPGTDGRKMSKSYGNTIEPLADAKTLKKQIMGIQTDSTPMSEAMDPDQCNVFKIFEILANPGAIEEMRDNYARSDFGYGHAKIALYDLIMGKFTEERDLYHYYMSRPNDLEDLLRSNAASARSVAREKLGEVREAVGFNWS